MARIAVPPNCLGFDIGISVLLFATDERNRRKYGRARSVHWSSGGRSCQHSPVSEQQKRSMSSFFRLVNRCRFFGWCARCGRRLMFWNAIRMRSGCLLVIRSPKVPVSCSRMLLPSKSVWASSC